MKPPNLPRGVRTALTQTLSFLSFLKLILSKLLQFDCSSGSSSGVLGQRSLSEDLPRNDHALDLVGPFVDLGDLGIAHHPFDWILPAVTVSA
jgi:hypothetical protein